MNYHFFWKGPLSQWVSSKFYCPITNLTFCNAEQYMMYKKAVLFGDVETASLIMQTTDPRTHKQLGRKVSNFDVDTWNKHAKSIVYRGNFLKFTQNPEMLEYMFKDKTHPTFVEASPVDKIWGIGMAEGDAGIEDRNNWKGLNWLGECLTAVRDDIKYKLTLFDMKITY